MKLLKKWAKWILSDEMEELKNSKKRCSELDSKNYDLLDQHKKDLIGIDKRDREITELKEENETLRKYYHLDKEPTEEQELEIRSKLRIKDLTEELNELKRTIMISFINRSPNYSQIQCYQVPPYAMLPWR